MKYQFKNGQKGKRKMTYIVRFFEVDKPTMNDSWYNTFKLQLNFYFGQIRFPYFHFKILNFTILQIGVK